MHAETAFAASCIFILIFSWANAQKDMRMESHNECDYSFVHSQPFNKGKESIEFTVLVNNLKIKVHCTALSHEALNGWEASFLSLHTPQVVAFDWVPLMVWRKMKLNQEQEAMQAFTRKYLTPCYWGRQKGKNWNFTSRIFLHIELKLGKMKNSQVVTKFSLQSDARCETWIWRMVI